MFQIGEDHILSLPAGIWRIIPDPKGGFCLIETRKKEGKKVDFYVLELSGGTPGMSKVPCEGEWWAGIEAFSDGLMFLHGFPEADLPHHQGLKAISASEGDLIWEDQEMIFVQLTAEGILVRDSNLKMSLINLKTGKAKKISKQRIRELLESANEFQFKDQFFPTTAMPGQDGYGHAVKMSEKADQIIGPVEFLELDEVTVATWYQAVNDNRFHHWIGVTSDEQVLSRHCLRSDLDRFGLDGFMVYSGWLMAPTDQPGIFLKQLIA